MKKESKKEKIEPVEETPKYVSNNTGESMRQKLKCGELSPEKALKIAKKFSPKNPNFIKWIKGTGTKRYNQAIVKQEK